MDSRPVSSAATERLPAVPSDEAARLQALSRVGYRGTAILQHRALLWLDHPGTRVTEGLLIAALITLLLLALRVPIQQEWNAAIGFWLERTDTGLASRVPSPAQWLNVAIATVVAGLLSFLLPQRLLPLTYLLRFVVILQIVASLYFLFAAGSYPYTTPAHLDLLLQTGWLMLISFPWLLAACYFPLERSWTRRLVTTAAALGFYVVMPPLLAASHAVALQAASLLVHPVLYLVFGPPLFILWFVCIYAGALGWDPAGRSA